jgi:HEPN domain-containing protein
MTSTPQPVTLLYMLRFYADKFVSLTNALETLRHQMARHDRTPIAVEMDRSFSGKLLEQLRGHLDAMGMRQSRRKADAAINTCSDRHLGHLAANEILTQAIQDLNGTIYGELEDNYFLQLSPSEAEIFEAQEPFGTEVSTAFPIASEDIEEAAKCLALGRYTASVFHLMRTMECAVRSLCTKLSITNPDRVWGNLLSDMNKKIEVMPKGGVRDQWSQSSALLYNVKQAWRNDVMHPKETYTEEQATEVFQAVRSFMRHLSPLV